MVDLGADSHPGREAGDIVKIACADLIEAILRQRDNTGGNFAERLSDTLCRNDNFNWLGYWSLRRGRSAGGCFGRLRKPRSHDHPASRAGQTRDQAGAFKHFCERNFHRKIAVDCLALAARRVAGRHDDLNMRLTRKGRDCARNRLSGHDYPCRLCLCGYTSHDCGGR